MTTDDDQELWRQAVYQQQLAMADLAEQVDMLRVRHAMQVSQMSWELAKLRQDVEELGKWVRTNNA